MGVICETEAVRETDDAEVDDLKQLRSGDSRRLTTTYVTYGNQSCPEGLLTWVMIHGAKGHSDRIKSIYDSTSRLINTECAPRLVYDGDSKTCCTR